MCGPVDRYHVYKLQGLKALDRERYFARESRSGPPARSTSAAESSGISWMAGLLRTSRQIGSIHFAN